MSEISGTQHDPAKPHGLLGHSDLPLRDLVGAVSGELRRLLTDYETVHGQQGSVQVSRYGALGHIAREIPVQLYDHPDLCSQVKTAFATETGVYVNAHFAYQLLKSDIATGMAPTQGILNENTCLGVLAHEYAHIARMHLKGRCEGHADHETLNYVFDACINASLLDAYPHFNGKAFKHLIATTPAAVEHFRYMSEEQALYDYQRDPEAFEEIAGSRGPTMDQQGRHFGSTKELAEYFEKAGLSEELERLGLPPSSDVAAHEKLTKEFERRLTKAAQRTVKDLNDLNRAGARHAGGHIDRAFVEGVTLMHQPKLSLKMRLRKALPTLGRSEYGMTDELPDPIRYSPPTAMGMGSSPYLPGYNQRGRRRPTLIHMLDTSASMGESELSHCLTEIDGFSKTRGGSAPDHIVQCCDTALQGKPIILSANTRARLVQENREKRTVDVTGRGGTDLESCLAEICKVYEKQMRAGSIAALMYYSDLGAPVPSRARLPKWMPPVLFLCPEGCFDAGFASAVQGWGQVIPIAPGEIVTIGNPDVTTPPPVPTATDSPSM